MLQLIFQGFVEWSYELTLETWQYFSSALLDVMSLDFNYLKTHIPVIDDMIAVLIAVGWALLIGNLAFQALKSMASGLGFEGEDPKLLFARTFVFAFLLLASPEICEIGLGITSEIIALLQVPTAVNVTFLDSAAFSPLNASWLIVIIFDVILMFKVFQMILEMAERYVILAMLTITAPLAFAMGGSRATSEIFTGWCRMYGSMCLLMATHVIFFKLLLSVVSTVPGGIDVLPWMILILAIVKVARKADAIVTRIGLNPAITGDSLGVRIPGYLSYVVVRAVTKNAGAALGKMFGNNSGNHGRTGWQRDNGNANHWRSGHGPSPKTFFTDKTSSHSANEGRRESAQVSAVQQGGESRQGASVQAPQAHGESIRMDGIGHGPGTDIPKQSEHSARGQETRQTAVPMGMRRAPTHIRKVEGKASASDETKRTESFAYQSSAENPSIQRHVAQPGLAGKNHVPEQPVGTEMGSRGVMSAQPGGAVGSVGRKPEPPRGAGHEKRDVRMGSVGTATGHESQHRITMRTAQQETLRQSVAEPVDQGQHPQPGPAGIKQTPLAGSMTAGMPPVPTTGTVAADTRFTTRPETAPSARPGRNLVSSAQAPSGESMHSSPVRQESRQTSTVAQVSGAGRAPVLNHGVAGMQQGQIPAQQDWRSGKKPTGGAQMKQSVRGSSIKHAASPQLGKGKSSAKMNGSRMPRGSSHG